MTLQLPGLSTLIEHKVTVLLEQWVQSIENCRRTEIPVLQQEPEAFFDSLDNEAVTPDQHAC